MKTCKTKDGALIALIMDGNITDNPAMKREVLRTVESPKEY